MKMPRRKMKIRDNSEMLADIPGRQARFGLLALSVKSGDPGTRSLRYHRPTRNQMPALLLNAGLCPKDCRSSSMPPGMLGKAPLDTECRAFPRPQRGALLLCLAMRNTHHRLHWTVSRPCDREMIQSSRLATDLFVGGKKKKRLVSRCLHAYGLTKQV